MDQISEALLNSLLEVNSAAKARVIPDVRNWRMEFGQASLECPRFERRVLVGTPPGLFDREGVGGESD